MLLDYKGKLPKLGERVFIAEGAKIIGDVEIGDHSSVWFNTVIRGDVHHIRIGKHTNIQDLSILHVMKDQYPLILHDYVTIGHWTRHQRVSDRTRAPNRKPKMQRTRLCEDH